MESNFFLMDQQHANLKIFRSLRKNDENRRQLCKLISDGWSGSSAAAHLQKCNSVILVVDGKAHKLDARNCQVRSSLLVVNSILKTITSY